MSTWKKRLSTYTPGGPVIPTGRSASVHLQTDFERETNSKGVWKSISKFFAGPRSVSADRLAKPFTSNTVAGASKSKLCLFDVEIDLFGAFHLYTRQISKKNLAGYCNEI